MFLSAFGSISVFHFPSSFLSLLSWLSIFPFLCLYLYIPSFFLSLSFSFSILLSFFLSFSVFLSLLVSQRACPKNGKQKRNNCQTETLSSICSLSDFEMSDAKFFDFEINFYFMFWIIWRSYYCVQGMEHVLKRIWKTPTMKSKFKKLLQMGHGLSDQITNNSSFGE
jgi:hypothetical protein